MIRSSCLIETGFERTFYPVSHFAPSSGGEGLTGTAGTLSGHFPFLFLKMKIMVSIAMLSVITFKEVHC